MERLDDLQTGGLRIIQDPALFCFSTDSVLLADYARLHAREQVLDLGSGNGILPLLMYAREPGARFTALELQPALYDLLCRNIALNGLEDVITPVLGDMREFSAGRRPFDVCVCNPPYEKAGSGRTRSGATQEAARSESCITMAEICAAAARALRFGGRFYVCCPASRLAEVAADLKANRLEPKTLRMVHAAPDREARLCLLGAVRGGHEGLRIAPPLFLRDGSGRETEELRQIYNRGSKSSGNERNSVYCGDTDRQPG